MIITKLFRRKYNNRHNESNNRLITNEQKIKDIISLENRKITIVHTFTCDQCYNDELEMNYISNKECGYKICYFDNDIKQRQTIKR